jgi:hypothetical protein
MHRKTEKILPKSHSEPTHQPMTGSHPANSFVKLQKLQQAVGNQMVLRLLQTGAPGLTRLVQSQSPANMLNRSTPEDIAQDIINDSSLPQSEAETRSGSYIPHESVTLGGAGEKLDYEDVVKGKLRKEGYTEIYYKTEIQKSPFAKAFPDGRRVPDVIAVKRGKTPEILVLDITRDSGSITDIKPGDQLKIPVETQTTTPGRFTGNQYRPADVLDEMNHPKPVEVPAQNPESTVKPHFDKTVGDGKQVYRNLGDSKEFEGFEVKAKEYHWGTGKYTKEVSLGKIPKVTVKPPVGTAKTSLASGQVKKPGSSSAGAVKKPAGSNPRVSVGEVLEGEPKQTGRKTGRGFSSSSGHATVGTAFASLGIGIAGNLLNSWMHDQILESVKNMAKPEPQKLDLWKKDGALNRKRLDLLASKLGETLEDFETKNGRFTMDMFMFWNELDGMSNEDQLQSLDGIETGLQKYQETLSQAIANVGQALELEPTIKESIQAANDLRRIIESGPGVYTMFYVSQLSVEEIEQIRNNLNWYQAAYTRQVLEPLHGLDMALKKQREALLKISEQIKAAKQRVRQKNRGNVIEIPPER